jgi:hypothetical protein
VFLFLFVILAWLFKGRKDTKRFTYMLSPAVAVLVIYLSIMLIGPHGTAFFNQTLSQVKRTLGFKFSPGLNYGMGTAIQAIVSRYWIFFTDLVLLGPGSIYIAVKSVRAIFGRNGNEDTTLLAWAASGLLFMGVIALKNPHYLVLILFPIIAVVTVSLSKLTDKVVTGILLIFILLSTGTWILRYTTPHDHLLQDVQTYAATNIPVDASVFTTQPVCAVIQQVSCVQFEGISTQAAQEAAADQAQWILAYTSTTQQFAPIDPATNQLVATFLGFKDKVQVYKNLKVVSP